MRVFGWMFGSPPRVLLLCLTMAVVGVVTWLVGSILSQSTRAQFIDQAELTATVVGFLVTAAALVGAAYQLAITLEPPRLELRGTRLIPVYLTKGQNSVCTLTLVNRGHAGVSLDRVTLWAHIGNTDGGGTRWTEGAFTVKPLGLPPSGMELDWALVWGPVSQPQGRRPQVPVFELSDPVVLSPTAEVAFPLLQIGTVPNLAAGMFGAGEVTAQFHLSVACQRGSLRLSWSSRLEPWSSEGLIAEDDLRGLAQSHEPS